MFGHACKSSRLSPGRVLSIPTFPNRPEAWRVRYEDVELGENVRGYEKTRGAHCLVIVASAVSSFITTVRSLIIAPGDSWLAEGLNFAERLATSRQAIILA